MKETGLRITVETFKDHDRVVQTIMFDQRDLPPAMLLELQKEAVAPMKDAIGRVTDRWLDAAIKAHAGNA